MIDGARKRLPDVEFVLSPAEDLDLPDGQFDALVSAFGMPHFADHTAFVSEAARVLRPGGTLAFRFLVSPGEEPLLRCGRGGDLEARDPRRRSPAGGRHVSLGRAECLRRTSRGRRLWRRRTRRDVTLYFETDPAGGRHRRVHAQGVGANPSALRSPDRRRKGGDLHGTRRSPQTLRVRRVAARWPSRPSWSPAERA